MVNLREDVTTGSVRLDKSIKKIRTELERGVKASHKIAVELNKIKKDELFTDIGYDDFSSFAERYFGISKSQASRLTAIAETFLRPEFDGKYEVYNNSQLIEMLKANAAQLARITPDMTVIAIRDLIKSDIMLSEEPIKKQDSESEDNTESDDNTEKVEVLDKDGEPVSDYTTKHFDSYADLLNFLHDNDVISDITIKFKI